MKNRAKLLAVLDGLDEQQLAALDAMMSEVKAEIMGCKPVFNWRGIKPPKININKDFWTNILKFLVRICFYIAGATLLYYIGMWLTYTWLTPYETYSDGTLKGLNYQPFWQQAGIFISWIVIVISALVAVVITIGTAVITAAWAWDLPKTKENKVQT